MSTPAKASCQTKVTRVKAHLSVTEVKARYEQAEGKVQRRRWLIVRTLLAEPRLAAVAARQVGCSSSTLNHVVAAYNRLGPAAFERPKAAEAHRGRAHLKLEEERALLKELDERAAKGELVSAAPLRAALEKRAGAKVHPSSAHRLLARHGWRKLVPRPRHPKADAQAQEAHKKTSPRRPSPR